VTGERSRTADTLQLDDGYAARAPGVVVDDEQLATIWRLGSPAAGVLVAMAHTESQAPADLRLCRLLLDDLARRLPGVADNPLPEAALLRVMDAAQAFTHLAAAAARDAPVPCLSLALVILRADGLRWAALGAVQLHRVRDGELVQLTAPKPTPSGQDADVVPCLGQAAADAVDFSRRPLPLRIGDKLLLCNSRLVRDLGERQVAATLRFDPQEAADELLALSHAGAGAGRCAQAQVLALRQPARTLRDTSRVQPSERQSMPAASRAGRGSSPTWLPSGRSEQAAVALGLFAVLAAVVALLLPSDERVPSGDDRQSAAGASGPSSSSVVADPHAGAPELEATIGPVPRLVEATETDQAEPAPQAEVASPVDPTLPAEPQITPLDLPLQYRDLPLVGQ
jgi:hypothetical protein